HPNVVPLLGASWDSPEPLMLSPYMVNGDVLDYLVSCKKRGVEVDKLRMIHNIAAGMHYLHSVRNIIHADLKAQNVLVENDGTCRVTDFGTSKILSVPPERSTGHRAGTAAYMPPERLEGGGATKEGDVYAFAITAYRVRGPVLHVQADVSDLLQRI
ncbi:kinase-like protein, partial [Gonapodya prolifera JEL478]